MALPGYSFYSLGLWPVIMCEFTIEFNKEPDRERNFCFFPCGFKSKYHPWVFLLIFAVLSFQGVVSVFAGLLTGYLFVCNILGCLLPSAATAESLQNCLCACFMGNSKFVKISDAQD